MAAPASSTSAAPFYTLVRRVRRRHGLLQRTAKARFLRSCYFPQGPLCGGCPEAALPRRRGWPGLVWLRMVLRSLRVDQHPRQSRSRPRIEMWRECYRQEAFSFSLPRRHCDRAVAIPRFRRLVEALQLTSDLLELFAAVRVRDASMSVV